jgi:hypothetical protein
MPVYPISVPFSSYRGNDPRKLRKARRYSEVAQLCAAHINQKMESTKYEAEEFLYAYMAFEIAATAEEISDVMGSAGGGHNGIRVFKTR